MQLLSLALLAFLASPTQAPALPAGPAGARVARQAPFDARAVEHLLNRAGFGATPADIDAALALGREEFLRRLFAGFAEPGPGFVIESLPTASAAERRAMSLEERQELYRARRAVEYRQQLAYVGWWVEEMRAARHPLRERMVLFWHGFFTSNAKEVKDGVAMIRQNQLFRDNALGSYADLLRAIVRDPAMLTYLSNTKNTRAAPNENLARELMELFSLGEGNYSEDDVKEAARALTGYQVRDSRFRFHRRAHDPGEKTVLGETGNLNAEALVEVLLRQPACPRWVAGELLEHFEGRAPSEPRLEHYANFLREHEFQVEPFLRALFDDPEFYSDAVVGQRIQGPVEFMVGNCRRLDLEPPGAVIAAAASMLGQQLFGPPTVKGWDEGRAWITTSSFLQRGNFAGMLVGVVKFEDIFRDDPELFEDDPDPSMDQLDGGASAEDPRQTKALRSTAGKMVRQMQAPRWRRELDLRGRCRASGATSDAAIVERLAADLLAVELSPEARAALVGYLRGEREAHSIEEGLLLEKKAYAESTLRQLSHLILSLPEAQLN